MAGRGLLVRVVLLLASIGVSSVGFAPIAGADPVVPTDYRGTVTAIEPPVAGLRVEVLGGDAFLLLDNQTGLTVRVDGYENEPYLRFQADGTVEENQASRTTVLNRSRLPDGYSTAELQAAEDGAVPQWRVVADDGRYAWHDHRTHWMSPIPPLGRQRGDEILDQTVPVTVGEQAVDVRVQVVWEPRPSPLWPVAGALGALAILGVLSWRYPVRPALGGAITAAAALAAVVAAQARRGLPVEAAPSLLSSLIPVVAVLLGASAAGLVRAGRGTADRGVSAKFARAVDALLLLAALELALWAWLRRAVLWKAVVPTAGSPTVDRVTTAAALAVALFASVVTISSLARGPNHRPAPSGR